MMISNCKKPLVSMDETKIIQRFKGYNGCVMDAKRVDLLGAYILSVFVFYIIIIHNHVNKFCKQLLSFGFVRQYTLPKN